MPVNFGQVQIKRRRGKLEVQSQGQTPRGQKFLRKTVPLKAKRMDDPDFKRQLTEAVKAIFGEDAPQLPFRADVDDIGG